MILKGANGVVSRGSIIEEGICACASPGEAIATQSAMRRRMRLMMPEGEGRRPFKAPLGKHSGKYRVAPTDGLWLRMSVTALTRAVSSSLAQCELTHLAREPIDVD